jgi:hypothetical protein
MAGFESYKAGDLRLTLTANGWTEEQASACTGKSNLVHEVVKLAGKLGMNGGDLVQYALEGKDVGSVAIPQNEEIFVPVDDDIVGLDMSEVEFEDEIVERVPNKEAGVILYGSPDWSEHVFAQFSDDELISGNPTVGGLRRVAELLLGAITFSGPTDFKVHYPDNPQEIGRATVVYAIHIAWGADNPWLDINADMPTRIFSAIAGSYLGNTDDMYSVYPEAIAETRAEGRALRKALGLKNAVSHEELTDKDAMESVKISKRVFDDKAVEWSSDESISATQKHLIELKCRQMDVNVAKFINKRHILDPENYPLSFSRLDEVPRGIAGEMVKELTRYQSEAADESKEIPAEIIGFEEKV